MKKQLILIPLLLTAMLFVAGCSRNNVKFTLPQVNGGEFNSQVDAKGKPVLLAFMATHCGYCKMSVPMVNALQEKYADKGLVVLGVFSDPTPQATAAYIRDFAVNYPVIYQGGELSAQCMANGVPHFVLLNKNHEMVRVWQGYSPNHNFEEFIDRVVK